MTGLSDVYRPGMSAVDVATALVAAQSSPAEDLEEATA